MGPGRPRPAPKRGSRSPHPVARIRQRPQNGQTLPDAALDGARGDKPVLLVSACLLGVACNHEGRGSWRAVVRDLEERYRLVPVCPEVLGGLTTPRPAAEIQGGDGAD